MMFRLFSGHSDICTSWNSSGYFFKMNIIKQNIKIILFKTSFKLNPKLELPSVCEKHNTYEVQ